MNTMKQLIVFCLTCVFLLPIPISCNQTGSYNYTYIVQSITVEQGRVVEDGFFELRAVGINDSITSTSFGISFQADSLTVAEDNSIAYQQVNPLFSVALADPPPPISASSIDLISIYASDSIHTVNQGSFGPPSTLINLFQMSAFYDTNKTSVLSFIDNLGNWYIDESYVLHLEESLLSPYEGSFEVKITMDDGRELSAETTSVILK